MTRTRDKWETKVVLAFMAALPAEYPAGASVDSLGAICGACKALGLHPETSRFATYIEARAALAKAGKVGGENGKERA